LLVEWRSFDGVRHFRAVSRAERDGRFGLDGLVPIIDLARHALRTWLRIGARQPLMPAVDQAGDGAVADASLQGEHRLDLHGQRVMESRGRRQVRMVACATCRSLSLDPVDAFRQHDFSSGSARPGVDSYQGRTRAARVQRAICPIGHFSGL
jgi:hypothetical protein